MHIKPIFAAGIIAATFATQALTLAVKDVKIAQRYPWNGLVDIDYTVECDDKDADVYVYPVGYDKDYNLTEPIWTLTGEGANGQAVKAGKHRMTWDMAKDKGKNYNRAAYSIKMHAYAGAAPYMVIDLSAGSNAEKYPISYMSEMPENGWTDEYKGPKLVLKLIPAGTFVMGFDSVAANRSYVGYYNNNRTYWSAYPHRVKLSQSFYMAVFELTQQQYALIMGGSSSSTATKTGLTYDGLRGSTLGAKWPAHQQVDADSVIGKLRSRTGVTFDLPTESQWEFASRAGASAGDAISPSPNAYGLYGMNGSSPEWCLDRYYSNYGDIGTTAVEGVYIDPKGPSSGSYRVVRNADYYASGYCASRNCNDPTNSSVSYTYYGRSISCRLVALPAAK